MQGGWRVGPGVGRVGGWGSERHRHRPSALTRTGPLAPRHPLMGTRRQPAGRAEKIGEGAWLIRARDGGGGTGGAHAPAPAPAPARARCSAASSVEAPNNRVAAMPAHKRSREGKAPVSAPAAPAPRAGAVLPERKRLLHPLPPPACHARHVEAAGLGDLPAWARSDWPASRPALGGCGGTTTTPNGK